MDAELFLDAIRSEGDALLAAAQKGLDAPVPTCPGWTVEDVVWHTAAVYNEKIPILRERLREPPPDPPTPPAGMDPIVWFETARTELLELFHKTPPDTEVWTWHPPRQDAAFWSRRMAHETAVHRVDAELAHGESNPVEASLAIDGVDEVLAHWLIPHARKQGLAGNGETVHVRALDGEASWAIGFTDGGWEWERDPPRSGHWSTVVSGAASDILLFLWGRVPPGGLSYHDPADLLSRISALAKAATQ